MTTAVGNQTNGTFSATNIDIPRPEQEQQQQHPKHTFKKLSILTVGDGDFSGSLAILRAYQPHIRSMMITSLVSSSTELMALYPKSATGILKELELFRPQSDNHKNDRKTPTVTILFGVDATQLQNDSRILRACQQQKGGDDHNLLDYILFHHPHLGYNTDGEQQDHNGRHASLLAHYLFSARQLILTFQRLQPPPKYGALHENDDDGPPLVHVCLCAGQSRNWKLYPTVRRLGLELVGGRPSFASKPFWPHLSPSPPPSEEVAQDDTYRPRNTKEGSESRRSIGHDRGVNDIRKGNIENRKHGYWLSLYGYQHRATYPSSTQLSTVVNSHHYFFRIKDLHHAGVQAIMRTEQENHFRASEAATATTTVGDGKLRPSSGKNCRICHQDHEICISQQRLGWK
eukprot:scaffold10095_cov163-Amphora_coffeaeformis.AAC.2